MYEPYGPMVPNPHPQIRDFNAIMILQQPGCPHAGTNLQRVLEVFVSGETAQSLYASFRRAQGEPIATRPSPHDVLWKVRSCALSRRRAHEKRRGAVLCG